MRTQAQYIRNAILLVAVVVMANLVGQRFKFRLDLTADRRYSLSEATLKLLRDLPEAVTVTAWFTEEMPPDLAVARQDMKDLLVEYAARSNGNVVFEFIDPGSADSLEARAREEGLQQLLATTREKDKAENLRIYMGATVRMGDRKTVIPVIQQGSALEWTVSSAIKEVSIVEKPVVGLLQGHGEAPPEALGQLMQNLNVMYSAQAMAVYDTLPVHDRFAALLIVDPQDSIPQAQLARINDFMDKGRGVVLLYSPVQSDLGGSPVLDLRRTGVDSWLERHGIRVEPRIVTDARCNQVQVMQQLGNFQMPVPVAFPYFPVISSFAEHPVAAGLDVVTYQFCSPLSPTPDSSAHFRPLLFTSEKSNVLQAPQFIDLARQWSDADFPLGPQVVGAEVEAGRGPQRGRLIVFTNGGFATTGMGQMPQQLPQGNIDLVVNAVDHATGMNDLLGLRGKAVEYRPLDTISDARRASLKWMNLLLPIAGAVAYGLLRRAWRQRQRRQRTAPGHVR
jgi:gliding-associated putative ABC transporter substrate-binding component GldG